VQVAAGARVDGVAVEPAPEPLGGVRAARVAPAEDRRQRLPVPVDGDEAVREAGRRVGLLAAEDTLDELLHLRGVGRLVALLPQLARGLRAVVEALRAHGGRPDVEREHRHRRLVSPTGGS